MSTALYRSAFSAETLTEIREPESPGHNSSSQMSGETAHRSRSLVIALLITARPWQWTKNLLLLAAPAAAGVLTKPGYLGSALLATAAFTLASAGGYFINDTVDADSDRRHSIKRGRPVASGDLAQSGALAIGLILVAVAIIAALAWLPAKFTGLLGLYVGIAIAYSLWLKRIAVIDIAAVASGFILRAIAGGLATDVPISQWFVIVVSFGSLFVVAGKRFAEHSVATDNDHSRSVLKAYSPAFLLYVRAMSSAVAILGYCLWAFDRAQHLQHGIWIELSIAPFLIGVLRYALLMEGEVGEFPEEIFLRDPMMLVAGTAVAVTLGVGIYGG